MVGVRGPEPGPKGWDTSSLPAVAAARRGAGLPPSPHSLAASEIGPSGTKTRALGVGQVAPMSRRWGLSGRRRTPERFKTTLPPRSLPHLPGPEGGLSAAPGRRVLSALCGRRPGLGPPACAPAAPRAIPHRPATGQYLWAEPQCSARPLRPGAAWAQAQFNKCGPGRPVSPDGFAPPQAPGGFAGPRRASSHHRRASASTG